MEMMCFDKADSCLSPDAGQKAPQMRGSGNRFSNGKKTAGQRLISDAVRRYVVHA